MHTRTLTIALLVICLMSLLTACGAPSGAPSTGSTSTETTPVAAECTITFGAAVSLTGKTAKEGEWVKDGYELFKDKVNEAGGFKIGEQTCKIDITYYDDTGDPDTSAQLVEKLITEDKVNLLLGPYGTNPIFAASAISEKYEVPMVQGGGAGFKIFDRGYKYIFGTLPAAPNYLGSLLDLVKAKDPDAKTVAIMVENDGFATEVADGAAKHAQEIGLEVVYKEQYPKDVKDLSSMITAVKSKSPDIVLGSGHLNDSILIVKQAKELGLNPKAWGFAVGPTSPDFRTALDKDSDYIMGIGPWTSAMKFQGDDVFGTPQAFADAMRAKYGEEKYAVVPYQAASAAAALLAYQKAIEKAGSIEPKAIREALAGLDFNSFYGPIKFSPEGIILKPMGVVQWGTDGKLATVFPADAAEQEMVYPAPPWDQR